MNPNNQKENPAGLKNRNDQLGEDKAKQARQAKLEAMTGPELMDHIATLAGQLPPRTLTWDEESYKHIHGDTLQTMLADEAFFASQPSTLNR